MVIFKQKKNSPVIVLCLALLLLPALASNAQTDLQIPTGTDTTGFIQPRDSFSVGLTPQKHDLPDSVALAVKMIKKYYSGQKNFSRMDDPVIQAIKRLIFYIENGPRENTVNYLKSLPIELITETPGRISDSVKNSGSGTNVINVQDSLHQNRPDTIPVPDSLFIKKITRLGLTSDKDTLISIPDSSRLYENTITTDTLHKAAGGKTFYPLVGPSLRVTDSVKNALDQLIRYLEYDSTNLWLYNIHGDSIGITLKKDHSAYKRFWLKNELNDSLGIWVQAKNKNQLGFTLDDNVYFSRIIKGRNRRENLPAPVYVDQKLRKVRLRKIEKSPWTFRGNANLLLSQVYLSHWSKGGENAFTSIFKAEGSAKYAKEAYKWENTARLTYGLTKQSNQKIRKTEDTWEINSEMGWKASDKWFYSAGLNLKSQLYKGYNYPNDSVIVSGFLSPGNLYSTLGFEYKPGKVSSILFSPLTIKSVFVLDTGRIDQTKFGIGALRKAKSDVGPYIRIRYVYNFTEDVSMDNRLHLFTNYAGFKKTDLDWEMNLKVKLGPFFSVSLLTHTIYDSEVTFPVYDDTGTEVSRKARLQFKEWIGFGLGYKF